jgi:hypothetical protein
MKQGDIQYHKSPNVRRQCSFPGFMYQGQSSDAMKLFCLLLFCSCCFFFSFLEALVVVSVHSQAFIFSNFQFSLLRLRFECLASEQAACPVSMSKQPHGEVCVSICCPPGGGDAIAGECCRVDTPGGSAIEYEFMGVGALV